MGRTVVGVVDKPIDAQRLIDELVESCLCDRSDIGIMHRDAAGSGAKGAMVEGARIAGDTAAAMREALPGLLKAAGAVTRALPGGGMLRSVGKIGATIVDAGLGTAAEVARALAGSGVPEGEARRYGEAFSRGGVLVTVDAKTENIARCAQKLMMKHGAVAPDAHAARSAA